MTFSNPLYDALFAPHIDQCTPFLHLPDGNSLSHKDFLELSAQFAHYFCEIGLVAGDRVAAQVTKSPEALALYAACVQAGLVFLPLNTAYTSDELSYFIADSGAKLLITDHESQHDCRCETLESLIQASNDYPISFETVARSEDDLAALLYTSGTTGRAKGVMLSQKNLLSNAQALVKYWQFTEQDVLIHALPIFHTHGLFVACNVMLLAGGSMIFMPKFDIDTLINIGIPEATCMMGVPTFYTRLLADSRFSKELCQHIRLFISGSAPLLSQTHTEFEQRTGHRILERYGMTETSMNTSNPYDGERRAGTVGFPLPDIEIRVADPETHASLPNGEIGSIEVRGDNVFQGYWQMPEKTAEEFCADGFFITGDLGLIDERGYLHIVGRNKDLIISGGYNIYPKEIETVLDDQPNVAESAVIGIPHPDLGEAAIAVLVAQPNETIDLEAITATLNKSLARYKHPRTLLTVASLPRNSMGKVQKNLLRQEYQDMFIEL